MEQNKEQPEKITIEDLKATLRLIDIMSKRGAIQPIEMTGVGTLYEKIATFIAYSEKQETNQDK